MTIRQHIADLGGRKFALAAFVVASATAMRFTGHLTEGAYSSRRACCAGLLLHRNVAQKATAKGAP